MRALGGGLLILLCLGCQKTQAPPADGKVRVVFKHMRLYGDPTVLEQVFRDFEEKNPGVQVVSETLPNDSDLQHQFFVTNLEGRANEFDVMNLDIVWVPEFARAGWLVDLSERLAPEAVRKDFFPGPAEAVTYGGKTWAVPWFADSGLLYWRQDLLDKYGLSPPKSWAELEAAARTVLENEKDPSLKGFVWQGRQYEGLVCAALEVLWGFGADVIDANGQVVLDRPEAVAALDFLRRLLTSGVSPPQTTSADEEVARNLFGEGKAVFMRNWPYAISMFEREGSRVKGKFGYGPVPALPGRIGNGTLGGWQLAINRQTPPWKQEAAWKLIAHMVSPEVQRKLSPAYGSKPSLTRLYEDPEYLEVEPLARSLFPIFNTARPRPVTPYYLMLSQILQSEFSAAISGISTPEKSMKSAAAQTRMLIGEMQ